jgi:hypothetical protein
MTKPQIWVAVILILFLTLFFLGRLTRTDDYIHDDKTDYMQNEMREPRPELTGKDLVAELGCMSCHGVDLNGSGMGPSLYGLENNWSRDNLINYLRNPSSYSSDSRFQEYKQKFRGVLMPSYGHIDVKELGKIAEYLFGFK